MSLSSFRMLVSSSIGAFMVTFVCVQLLGKFAHALANATSKQIFQSPISLFVNPCPNGVVQIFPSLIIVYTTHIRTYQKFRQTRVPSACSDHKGGKIFCLVDKNTSFQTLGCLQVAYRTVVPNLDYYLINGYWDC